MYRAKSLQTEFSKAYSNSPFFDLSIDKEVKDVEGNTVIIPTTIGRVKKSQLEAIIADAQEKLNAINQSEQ